MNLVGKRLLELRKKKKLKQIEAAKLIGITSASLSRYETNNRTPDTEILNKLSEFYNVPPSYILFGVEYNRKDFFNNISEEEEILLKEYLIKISNDKKNKL